MKQLYKIYILINILVIPAFACRDRHSPGPSQTMDFSSFTLEAPSSWKAIKEKGVDSYVGKIAIEEGDTLHFDLGGYSNNLTEYDPTLLDSSMISSIDPSMADLSNVIFVKDKKDIDPDQYRKNNVRWDTIDGRKAKIVFPRRSGIGTTGIYIDSLWISGDDTDRFNLYGLNLKPGNEIKVLDAIKTLKFRKS